MRLSVFCSGKNIHAQVIDDIKGVTLASASTVSKDFKDKSTSNIEAAEKIGTKIAEIAKKSKIKKVVFDKGGRKYHGKIKALADKARDGGLEF